MAGEATRIVPGKTSILWLGLISPAFLKSELLNLLFTLTHSSDSKNDGAEPSHDSKPSLDSLGLLDLRSISDPRSIELPIELESKRYAKWNVIRQLRSPKPGRPIFKQIRINGVQEHVIHASKRGSATFRQLLAVAILSGSQLGNRSDRLPIWVESCEAARGNHFEDFFASAIAAFALALRTSSAELGRK